MGVKFVFMIFSIAFSQDFDMDMMSQMGMPGMGGMDGMGGSPPQPPGIISLDRFSFQKVVSTGLQNVLVFFGDDYSDREQFDELAWQLSDSPNIILAQVTLSSGS